MILPFVSRAKYLDKCAELYQTEHALYYSRIEKEELKSDIRHLKEEIKHLRKGALAKPVAETIEEKPLLWVVVVPVNEVHCRVQVVYADDGFAKKIRLCRVAGTREGSVENYIGMCSRKIAEVYPSVGPKYEITHTIEHEGVHRWEIEEINK